MSREDWEQNRADGFRYCAIVEHDAIAALAAVWTYSQTHWEVAAVSTAPAFRKREYGKAVVCYVTAHILEQGRKACTGYLVHPFKNKRFEMGKNPLPLLANTGGAAIEMVVQPLSPWWIIRTFVPLA